MQRAGGWCKPVLVLDSKYRPEQGKGTLETVCLGMPFESVSSFHPGQSRYRYEVKVSARTKYTANSIL